MNSEEFDNDVREPEGARKYSEAEGASTDTEQVAGSARVQPLTIVDPALEKEADVWLGLDNVRPLFNPASPKHQLKRERPEHRIIIFLKAQGHTYVEIAQRIGWSAPGVANVCKQPFAQRIIMEEITKAGRNPVEMLLSDEAYVSLQKLVSIRDSETAPIETQRKAANDLLDRVYGKPNQPITKTDVDPKDLSDLQLAQIARQGISSRQGSN